jgi:RNA polymerase sigma factor (sigma-70 family)
MNGRSEATDGPGTPTGAALFRQAQAGCRDSLARLMATHEGLEALQAGRIGLWRAILHFDPQHGTAFSTYAWTCIMHRVWREVKLAGRAQGQAARHLPLSEVASCACEDRDPARDWEAFAVSSALWGLIARLPQRLRIVVLARYELTGQPQVFYAQIGAALGVSGERARQLHTEAVIWLRQPAHSQQLRSLLNCHTLAAYEAVEAETQQWLRWRGGRRG